MLGSSSREESFDIDFQVFHFECNINIYIYVLYILYIIYNILYIIYILYILYIYIYISKS